MLASMFRTKLIVHELAAVKCNPDPHVLHLLAALGLGFDCASQPEISSILSLPIPVDPSRIIYANPCKAPSFIRHAASKGVDYMTFDNGDELAKVKKYHPDAKMVLRILTDDSGSLCRLGLKFGAPLGEVRALLQKAKLLGITVKGISFHCGSGCTNPALYGDAVRRALWAFEVGKEEGFSFDFLDIGGGFEDDNFEQIAAVLRVAIEEHFPREGAGKGVRIIAEPGRYYVSKAFELATNIIARRAAHEGTEDGETPTVDMGIMDEQDEEKPSVMCEFDARLTTPLTGQTDYVNDGVYGAFNCILFDHQIVHPHVLTLDDTFQSAPLDATLPLETCSVWGPTCDSIDCVQPRAVLPTGALRVGDWLRWEKMGAYTICAASQVRPPRASRATTDACSSTGSDGPRCATRSTAPPLRSRPSAPCSLHDSGSCLSQLMSPTGTRSFVPRFSKAPNERVALLRPTTTSSASAPASTPSARACAPLAATRLAGLGNAPTLPLRVRHARP